MHIGILIYRSPQSALAHRTARLPLVTRARLCCLATATPFLVCVCVYIFREREERERERERERR